MAGMIRQLGLCHKGSGFGADKFLFEDKDSGGIGLFVFQVRDLIDDLLLAFMGLYLLELCA